MAPKNGNPTRLVYIHGIRTTDRPSTLTQNWNEALFGKKFVGLTAFAYWADIVNKDLEPGIAEKKTGEAKSVDQIPFHDMLLREWTKRNKARAGEFKTTALPDFFAPPLEPFLRLQQDINAYLFQPKTRAAINERVLRHLEPSAGPYLIVAHSLGSVIAYVLLRDIAAGKYPEYRALEVPTLITIGSPLGVLKPWMKKLTGKPAIPTMVRTWGNLYDFYDCVAADGEIANDYPGVKGQSVTDTKVVNKDRKIIIFPSSHSATGYLETPEVRQFVNCALPTNFADHLSTEDRVARDLRNETSDHLGATLPDSELSTEGPKISVLIELTQAQGPGDSGIGSLGARHAGIDTLDDRRKKLVNVLKKVCVVNGAGKRARGGNRAAPEIEILERYVAARIDPRALARLEGALGEKEKIVHRIWKNSTKRAYLVNTSRVLQAEAAHVGYSALGEGITWAVLDTGIRSSHSHFSPYQTIEKIFDCTKPDTLTANTKSSQTLPIPISSSLDPAGHGTHVAGIIAGSGQANRVGIAPKAKLRIYKVLGDDGSGEDSFIIRALDHIHSVNEQSEQLVVHGVNLSLGGPFDPEVYACGHSPLCKELRRLWRQGVVVCVAAGNEGHTVVSSTEGFVPLNTDLSIGDPANLEECIAVGSISGEMPHQYGTSFFSSRGPTADGRIKPDVVAPGEKVESCDARQNNAYVAMSGTSMACPAVSGLIAAFLSVRREFIGYPDQVKDILMSNCTDLKRDKYHQGSGMPNLIRMLVST
ncbi:MAG: S8 family peptidase [Candidatus Hydrogenedentes bacterium]|nr:S8 family peptidase [Candidatus Hydrogenedentota bacterium]